MQYRSTRNSDLRVSDAEAIVAGLAPDGGLFLPDAIPGLSLSEIEALCPLSYPERAAFVLSGLLPGFSREELLSFTRRAYGPDRFSVDVAPLVRLDGQAHVLELFHGPTCAFKDFALQMLPYLLTASLQKTGVREEIMILVATSGDTGKAALEGFADVPGTRIFVFYPEGGTSPMQRIQMTTQAGKNVMVSAVKGNFDDAQNGVKAIFSDKALNAALKEAGVRLTSANSINWGRLAPQTAYYISAYCDLLTTGAISLGEKINICVPTGNFGNILAAWYAKRMGLPVNRFICASNENNVLTDFLQTGVYDRNRPFHLTSSPSMDILISSNLERLLYLLSGSDAAVRGYMGALKSTGRYDVGPDMLRKLQAEFDCGFCNDARAAGVIVDKFQAPGYLCDPHTAVALGVYEDYRARTGDETQTVIASTASPFKFCKSVLSALGKSPAGDDFEMLRALSVLSEQAPPARLTALQDRPERFTGVSAPAEMEALVRGFAEARL